MNMKKEKAIEYAKMRYSCNNGNRETNNEIAKVIACRVGFEAGWDAAKQELMKEFREHFCEPYCLYFGNDDYCRCCPIKDEKCWLNGDRNNDITNSSEKNNNHLILED